MISPAKFCPSQRKAEPEDGIIRSSLDDDATPSRDSLRAVISKLTADSSFLLRSADNDFLTPTLGFGKKTPQMMSLERQVRVVAGSWFSPRTAGLLRQSGLDPLSGF